MTNTPNKDKKSGSGIFRTLAKSGTIIFGGFVAELGISFLAKLIIARHLGRVSFGAVALGNTTLSIVSILSAIGLNVGVARYLPRCSTAEERRGVILSGLQLAIPFALATASVLIFFPDAIATVVFHDPHIASVLRIFGAGVPFAVFTYLSVGIARGFQQSAPKVIIQNFTLPITRFSLIAGAVVLGANVLVFAYAYIIPYVVATLIGVGYLCRRTPTFSRDIIPTREHRELLSFSAPLIVTVAMLRVMSDIDTFILGAFGPTGAVGIYNVVYQMAGFLTVALTALGFIILPIVSDLQTNNRWGEIEQIYKLSSKWVLITTLPPVCLFIFFPSQVIAATFGPEYTPGAVTLIVLTVGFLTHAVAGLNSNVLTAMGRTSMLAKDNIGAALLNVILNIVLIPRYSYVGAAIATTLTFIARNSLYAAQLYFETKIHPFTLDTAGVLGIAVVTFGTFVGAIKILEPRSRILLFGGFALLSILYVFLIINIVGLDEEELDVLRAIEDRFGLRLRAFILIVETDKTQ